MAPRPLSPARLRRPAKLPARAFRTTTDLADAEAALGQDGAVEAIEIKREGTTSSSWACPEPATMRLRYACWSGTHGGRPRPTIGFTSTISPAPTHPGR